MWWAGEMKAQERSGSGRAAVVLLSGGLDSATVLAFARARGFYLINGEAFPPPFFMIFSGGLMLGAMYMATDMVTSPVTNQGAWIFAAGIGVLVVLIRVWGGLPEGVMYAILLMNAATPLLERRIQPSPFGRGKGGRR